MSILITSVLNCTSDMLAVSLLPSCIFSGALICSFIWAIFFFLSWRICYIKGWSLRCSPGQGNPRRFVVMLYVGEGTEREQCRFLCSLPDFSHLLCYPQAKWTLLVLIPRWVGLCPFQDPAGLSNELTCEAGSLSCCRNPYRSFQSEVLSLYFPALEPWVVQSVSLPSCSSWFICT